MTIISRITLATVFCLGSVFAQNPSRTAREARGVSAPTALQSVLSLIDSQIERLRANNRAFRDEVRPLVRDMSAKQRELRQEMRQRNPNDAIVGSITMDIQRIEERIEAVRLKYQRQARAVLNQVQLDALAPIEADATTWQAQHQAAMFNLFSFPEPEGDEGSRGRSQSSRGGRR